MENKIKIVYCKDCKHFKRQKVLTVDGEFFEIMFCQKLDIEVKDGFYCGFGERFGK